MRYLFNGLWIGPEICVAVTLAFFVAQNRRKRLPAFFTYLIFELVFFVAGVAAYVPWVLYYPNRVSLLYYFILLFGGGIARLLELTVIYEIAMELVFSHPRLTNTLRALLRWSAALLLLVASVVSAMLFRPGASPIMRAFGTIEFSANLMALGLLLVLIIFTRALNVSWRGFPIGIALGFGVSASADISASALVSAFAKAGYLTTDLISMAAFQVCTLVWLIYILRADPPRELSGTTLQLSDLEILDEQMRKMMQR